MGGEGSAAESEGAQGRGGKHAVPQSFFFCSSWFAAENLVLVLGRAAGWSWAIVGRGP